MLYTNGAVSESVVSVVLGSGWDSKGRYWEWRCTPAFAVRLAEAQRYAIAKWGRKPLPRAGANLYRNRAWQVIARTDACASGNCNGASVVGYSSHGGNWYDWRFKRTRNCLAIDINRNGLTWAQVDEAMTHAGFAAGLITEAISGIEGGEPWHYILFDDDAFGAVPAFANATPFPISVPEEDDMFTDADRALLNAVRLSQGGGFSIVNLTDGGIYILSLVTGNRARIGSVYHVQLLQRAKKSNSDDLMLGAELEIVKGYITAVNPPVGVTVDTQALADALSAMDDDLDATAVTAAVGAAIEAHTTSIATAVNDQADQRERDRLGPA